MTTVNLSQEQITELMGDLFIKQEVYEAAREADPDDQEAFDSLRRIEELLDILARAVE